MHTVYVLGTHGGQMKVLDSLELELQMVVSHLLGIEPESCLAPWTIILMTLFSLWSLGYMPGSPGKHSADTARVMHLR